MQKDFDAWNMFKQVLHRRNGKAYAHPREVWWCALGVNIGAEIDGKNNNYERPVLVMRVYNLETLLVLPITSKKKEDKFHCKVSTKQGNVWIALTQVRVISSSRLIRKVDSISISEFKRVQHDFARYT